MARNPNNKGAAAPATQAQAATPAPAQQAAAAPAKATRPAPEMKNGVQRPRAGGLCAAVWELTEQLSTDLENGGKLPTIAEVKAAAVPHGLNPANVSIEYYRCRQFHGVRGRQSKPAQAIQQKA